MRPLWAIPEVITSPSTMLPGKNNWMHVKWALAARLRMPHDTLHGHCQLKIPVHEELPDYKASWAFFTTFGSHSVPTSSALSWRDCCRNCWNIPTLHDSLSLCLISSISSCNQSICPVCQFCHCHGLVSSHWRSPNHYLTCPTNTHPCAELNPKMSRDKMPA